MNGSYVIAVDMHSYSCHLVVLTPSGRVGRGGVVFEEGPLAGWAYHNLHHDADEVIVAETRRNAFIAKDGDKCAVPKRCLRFPDANTRKVLHPR